MIIRHIWGGLWLAVSFSAAFVSAPAAAQPTRAMAPGKASIIDHWTGERRASAIPRDLVIDPRGLGYLKRPDGSLVPHGHATGGLKQNEPPVAMAAGGAADSTPPAISNMDPGANATIGATAYTFSATVTDPSGVKSVTFKIQKAGATAQSFAAVPAGNGTWTLSVQGLTDGDWNWSVIAKDGARKGGNAGSSGSVAFQVSTGTAGGGSGDTVTSAHWTSGGYVKSASGRVYFEMPGNANRQTWWGYVCSGTVASDGTTGRSIIITAAHCVYDDANKAFARNVMFIPDQDGTTGAATDRNCVNDPIGCWVASFGVVDVNWSIRTFPNNVAWDYGYYVVADSGAHAAGIHAASDILDEAAGSLPIRFGSVFHDDALTRADYTRALGYSYSEDPKLMYCAEDMTTEGAVNWWLPSCALSGGSSGGPWVQPLGPDGFGDVMSVNSWGYTSRPGMAGPILVGTSASCVFEKAKTDSPQNAAPPDGDAGMAVSCP